MLSSQKQQVNAGQKAREFPQKNFWSFGNNYGPKKTRPVWFVPEKKPEPKSCFCNTTPLKEIVLPVAGSGTLPLNKPDVVVIVRLSLLVPVTLLLAPRTTWLVKSAARFPFTSDTWPVLKLSTGTLLVNR